MLRSSAVLKIFKAVLLFRLDEHDQEARAILFADLDSYMPDQRYRDEARRMREDFDRPWPHEIRLEAVDRRLDTVFADCPGTLISL